MKILLIGPQGSGKSTQASLLAEQLNIPKISTGDIFREMMEVKEILAVGQLVDDEMTANVVRKRLQENDCQSGFIIDGYPRTMEQINIFEPSFDKIIYLNVPRDEVVARLKQRGRADDTSDLINKRLDLYYQQTQPVLDHYKKLGILMEVNGIGSVEEIQDEIKKSI